MPDVVRVVAAAVVIRVVVLSVACLGSGSAAWLYTPDAYRYVAAGQNLATTGQLTFGGAPEILRLPGYPLLLALTQLTGHLTLATVAVQIVLGAWTVWLTYRLGALTGDAVVARRAGYLAAVDPLLVLYTGLIMTETLFTWLAAWSVYRCLTAKTRPEFAFAGLLAGLSALVRLVGLFLPIVIAAGVVVSRLTGPVAGLNSSTAAAVQPADLQRRLTTAAIIILSGGIVIGAWCVRNGVVAGYWGYSSQLDRRLLLTEAGADMAASQGRDLRDVADELRASLRTAQPSGASQPEGAVALQARRDGLRYLREHWAGVLWQHLRGSVMSLLHPPGGEANPLFSASPQAPVTYHLLAGRFREARASLVQGGSRVAVWRLVRSVYWIGFLLLIGAGAWSVARGDFRTGKNITGMLPLWPIVAVVALYLFVAAGTPYASSRFRHPLMPFLCLTAAVGVRVVRRRNV